MTNLPAYTTMLASPARHEVPAHEADLALAARAAGGDAAAFEVLMRRHNRLLFRAARGIAGDDAEAEDAVQDAWLRAFERLGTWRGEAALSTWLARIAVNAALDAQRRRGRVIDWTATPADPDEAMEPAMALPADTPDAAAERGELRTLLERAIEALPPSYRSVFMLRAVQEMSVEETAFALQVSGDVVKTRFLRARAMLRDTLAARLEPSAPQAFAFAGERCDRVVAQVITTLQRQGRLRRDPAG